MIALYALSAELMPVGNRDFTPAVRRKDFVYEKNAG